MNVIRMDFGDNKPDLPEVVVTPKFFTSGRLIDVRTGNTIVRASARLFINGVQRKVICCIGVEEEYANAEFDGQYDKTSEQFLSECAAEAEKSVMAMDSRSHFAQIGDMGVVISLDEAGIVPPKMKEAVT